MSIRKRTWQGGGGQRTAWLVDYIDQQGKRHVKTFPTKRGAEEWSRTALYEVQRGTHTADSASIAFVKAAENWIAKGEADGLETSTIAQRRQHVELHLIPLLGTERLSRLTAPHLEDIRDQLVKKLSRSLAKKVLTSLKAILGEAQRRGHVAQNAATGIKIDIGKRHQRKLQVGVDVPTKDEVRSILVHAKGRWRPVLVTAIFTGLRASELRGLRWADVDLNARLLLVRQRADRFNIGRPKSHAGERTVPMAPLVVNTLKEWRLACPKGERDLVFPNGRGNVEMLSNIWRRGLVPVQMVAGVTALTGKMDKGGKPILRAKYGLHALRHFFASYLIDQGFPPKKVQALMGHSSIQMTFDLYGHLFPNEKDDLERLAAGELALIGPAKAPDRLPPDTLRDKDATRSR
jgi:integrase